MNKNNNLDIKLLQQTINEILPNLNMYARDVELDNKLAMKYKIGMIIKEKGFTDASCRVMGMVTSHRFAILSNHMADLREMEQGTNWGLFVAQRDAHFKVLDIYEHKGKTQILLLHLPDDERWRLFENVELSVEESIVADCRKRFEDKCLLEPIPELAKRDWLDRCVFPLGMSDEGDFFKI